jgi:class 3 adenylate cyclase
MIDSSKLQGFFECEIGCLARNARKVAFDLIQISHAITMLCEHLKINIRRFPALGLVWEEMIGNLLCQSPNINTQNAVKWIVQELVTGFEIGIYDHVSLLDKTLELRHYIGNQKNAPLVRISQDLLDRVMSLRFWVIDSLKKPLSVVMMDMKGSERAADQYSYSGAINLFRAVHGEIIRTLESLNGVAIVEGGDAILAFFQRAEDALKGIITVQEALRKQTIQFRASISYKDVYIIFEGDRYKYQYYSPATLEAARVLNRADAGKVLVSKSFHDELVMRLSHKSINSDVDNRNFDDKSWKPVEKNLDGMKIRILRRGPISLKHEKTMEIYEVQWQIDDNWYPDPITPL